MSEWLPIESAPRDGTRIIVLDISGLIAIARSTPCGRRHSDEWSADGRIIMRPSPTHWMPLPTPPQSSASDQSQE